MWRRLGIGVGLLLLTTLVVGHFLRGEGAVDGSARGARSSGGDTEGRRSSWSALLAAPIAPRGDGMMRGRVVGPEGPVAGAVVVATEATPDEPLREQPCDCGRPCELKLLSMSCRPEGLLAWLESGAGEPPPQARTTTDAEGRFTLAGLAAGQYSVWAEGPRGVGLAEGVATGSEDVEVRLGGGPSLSGRVWDELEQPVADARVTAILVAHHR